MPRSSPIRRLPFCTGSSVLSIAVSHAATHTLYTCLCLLADVWFHDFIAILLLLRTLARVSIYHMYHSSESGAEGSAAKREKRRVHAQQAAALRQKISVLLCRPLLPPPAASTSVAEGEGGASASVPKSFQQSAKELRKKMGVLKMIHDQTQAAAVAEKKGGAGAPEDRAAAQTRWLDLSAGHLFGGSWTGSVRTGASCDSASQQVRAQVEIAKQVRKGEGVMACASGKGGGVVDVATSALARWNPNPDTPDPDKWGGRWGKPCGHNEVRREIVCQLNVSLVWMQVGGRAGRRSACREGERRARFCLCANRASKRCRSIFELRLLVCRARKLKAHPLSTRPLRYWKSYAYFQ